MELYWNFARFIVSKTLNIGSPKIGSLPIGIIILKIPALANGERELFARLLRTEIFLFYQERLHIFTGFCVGNRLIDFGNLEFCSQLFDLFIQLGMDGQKVKIRTDITHGVLG